jgi:hypothetical protein
MLSVKVRRCTDLYSRAYSVLIESEPKLQSLFRRVFFMRTGIHPRIKSEGMLRSKTL